MTDAQAIGSLPSVFVFNPFAEGFIAWGKAFTPVKEQVQLARDLAHLPQFLCGPADIVLAAEPPAAEVQEGLRHAGFARPEFVRLKDGAIDRASDICQRKLDRLRPWAWGPDSVELMAPLFANAAGEGRAPGQSYNRRIAQLYSKAWSAELLRQVLGRCAEEAWLCTAEEAGVAADSLASALAAVQVIRARGHHRVVVKEALGVAGHNSIRLWEPELLEPQRTWIASAAARGRQLVIEPWLERAGDLSVQLEMERGGLRLCGYTGLVTDLKGQFQANWAAADYAQAIPARLAALLGEPGLAANRALRLYDGIFGMLERELEGAGYLGPVGIDAFVYRDARGRCRLKPIVEINPRYTMGRLAVELMEHAARGSCGLVRLVSRRRARAEGFETLAGFAARLREAHPLVLESGPPARIREGALCLNDPAQAQSCLALFQVGPDPRTF